MPPEQISDRGTTPATTSPTLFEECGFFNIPHKCCETGLTVYCRFPRRLSSLLGKADYSVGFLSQRTRIVTTDLKPLGLPR